MVPLHLPNVRMCGQWWREDGTICVVIIAIAMEQCCPCCQQRCEKIHDRRPRRKRDLPYQTTRLERIVIRRQFRYQHCQNVFPEPDTACGWRRRTTVHLREAIGEQAFGQPLTHGG